MGIMQDQIRETVSVTSGSEQAGGLTSVPGLSTAVLMVAGLTGWMLTYPFDFDNQIIDNPWLMNNRIGKLNTVANILLFMPYGVLATWLGATLAPKRREFVIVAVVLGGALLSLTAETMQVWLPERASALVDVATNATGACIGGIVGWRWAARATKRWRRWARWLGQSRSTRFAVMAFVVVVIARTAPFDISPETFYLRFSLQDTSRAGLPMSAMLAWYQHPAPSRILSIAARNELLRVTMDFALFAGLVVAIGVAIISTDERWRDRTFPIESVILFGVGLVLATEFLQWPIRSRMMDASDALAGVLGVVLGSVGVWVWYLITRLRESY